METIQIQSVGKVPAIPASSLWVDDIIVFNFGHLAKVTDVAKITKAFTTFILFDYQTKSECIRRFKTTRLVAVTSETYKRRAK
tara:strand:+ start:237 stop:485 length:249 start_codon:yes stop_codon:yes gene_type:complete